jgi:hypothetical protein
MPMGLNRTLQVRTANRLRADLPRDASSGLPAIGALSELDQRELSEVGGGRLTAVAICVVDSVMVGEVVRVVAAAVRRTDLFGWLNDETLVVLAPGLDPVAGQALADRLRDLFVDHDVEIDGQATSVQVEVGSAHRSGASGTGWTIRALTAEAELQAAAPLPPAASVA